MSAEVGALPENTIEARITPKTPRTEDNILKALQHCFLFRGAATVCLSAIPHCTLNNNSSRGCSVKHCMPLLAELDDNQTRDVVAAMFERTAKKGDIILRWPAFPHTETCRMLEHSIPVAGA